MCEDTCQLSLVHSCNTIGFPFGTHLGKTPKATHGASRLEVWVLMIGGSGKPSELRSRGNCGRRLLGTNWEQAWRAGQISPRCSSMTSSWKETAEACCWQRLQRRAGLRSDDIEQGWWNRRSAPDATKRRRTCIIEFGNVNTGEIFD